MRKEILNILFCPALKGDKCTAEAAGKGGRKQNDTSESENHSFKILTSLWLPFGELFCTKGREIKLKSNSTSSRGHSTTTTTKEEEDEEREKYRERDAFRDTGNVTQQRRATTTTRHHLQFRTNLLSFALRSINSTNIIIIIIIVVRREKRPETRHKRYNGESVVTFNNNFGGEEKKERRSQFYLLATGTGRGLLRVNTGAQEGCLPRIHLVRVLAGQL